MKLYDEIARRYDGVIAGLLKNGDQGDRFQDALAEYLAARQPAVVVESGVECGVSSDRILSAMDEAKSGLLYSCDIGYNGTTQLLFFLGHPRWHTYLGPSYRMLPKIALDESPWDVFLHDSDHGIECQTFEYEFAWPLLKPGGILASDDITWGTPEHGAWRSFCECIGQPFTKIGSCGVVIKPDDALVLTVSHESITEHWRRCLSVAAAAARAYGIQPQYDPTPTF